MKKRQRGTRRVAKDVIVWHAFKGLSQQALSVLSLAALVWSAYSPQRGPQVAFPDEMRLLSWFDLITVSRPNKA
jgi:hypothetical protein